MIYIDAIGVRSLGGLEVLRSTLKSAKINEAVFIVDASLYRVLPELCNRRVIISKSSPLSRLMLHMRYLMFSRQDTLLVLSLNLPLLPLRARTILFLQNRLIICRWSEAWKVADRSSFLSLAVKRMYFRIFYRFASEVHVQTESMKELLEKVRIKCLVRPLFEPDLPQALSEHKEAIPRYDFLYVATSERHKNHSVLINAWRILAEHHLYPTLALTIAEEDIDEILLPSIHLISTQTKSQLHDLYSNVRAIIYPSCCESFGLPLLEADVRGIPIIASDLGFVHDVCVPIQTFNPECPRSIAAAVMRFLCYQQESKRYLSSQSYMSLLRQR